MAQKPTDRVEEAAVRGCMLGAAEGEAGGDERRAVLAGTGPETHLTTMGT